MKFRTEIKISQLPPINTNSHLLMIGSCFTENIYAKFQSYKIPIVYNPFGITYNPVSIADQISSLYTNKRQKIDVIHNSPYPFAHHGSFRKNTLHETNEAINRSWQNAQKECSNINTCILTFGSAYAWKRNNRVVNNCHKRPATEFSRELLPVDTIVSSIQESLNLLPQDCSIIFTISPVRHIRDGLIENNISKSTLRIALHELEKQDPRIHYFPSFEIMMDDLRDYRFYKDDLLHPSSMAVNYIWELFKAHSIENTLEARSKKIRSLHKRLSHRPQNTNSDIFSQFVQKTEKELITLQESYPALDWKPEQEALIQLTALSL